MKDNLEDNVSFEKEAAAVNAAIKKSTSSALPEIGEMPAGNVTLLRGLLDVDNVWHTDAIVRELTGEDEEVLSGLEAKPNVSYGDYMTAMLSRAVVSVGPLKLSEYPTIVDDLVVADRDLLFIGVVKATYGEQRKFTIKCVGCGESNDVNVDLTDDFPIVGTTEEIRAPRTVTLRNGMEVGINHPTGGDSRFVAKHSKNTAEQNTALIARCVTGHGAVDAMRWAKKLGVADRSLLVKEIVGRKYGPQAEEVNAPCGHCGDPISFTVDWVSLLLG